VGDRELSKCLPETNVRDCSRTLVETRTGRLRHSGLGGDGIEPPTPALARENPRWGHRDRDSKYRGPFDEVFRSEGIRVVISRLTALPFRLVGDRIASRDR
jgi:hypothetical protein